jgi:signal peptide peptidase SppA
VIPLHGVIGTLGPLRRGLSFAALAAQIERAFALRRVAAVALAINSPGGSPVQASLIARRIRTLADRKSVPVLAFIEDVGASGGYWLAAAADEIYADPASVVGSIGVKSSGFGFVGLLDKLGIERRLHVAGADKGMLDPFQPEDRQHVEHLKSIQDDLHETFKDWVRSRRGPRLNAPETALFSGAFWSGRQALGLGLIDGMADLRSVVEGRFGEDVRIVSMGQARRWWRRRLGLGAGGTDAHIDQALAAVEERILWSRYGR